MLDVQKLTQDLVNGLKEKNRELIKEALRNEAVAEGVQLLYNTIRKEAERDRGRDGQEESEQHPKSGPEAQTTESSIQERIPGTA